MSTYRTKAIVLARRPLQENNRVYILYTRDIGKLEVVARGSRKILSKLAPHMEPPVLVDVMIARGKKIDKLAGAMAIKTYPGIRCNFSKIQVVLECKKILNSLTYTNQREEKIWGLLEKFLEICEDIKNLDFEEKKDIIKNAYLIKLLAFLGYKPEIQQCVLCKEKKVLSSEIYRTEESYLFDYVRGGVVCDKCKNSIYTNSFLEIKNNTLEELSFLLGKKFSEMIEGSFKISDKTVEVIDCLVKAQQNR